PLLDAGRLQRLTFHNTRNELQLPVHVFWRKQQPLLKAARMLVERLALR
ncbi:MAG: LysR family transcriptional regulator, partial [Pseudomonas sp.]|nr:LysR family transcriptional regulator [Pseudomonas sp.]